MGRHEASSISALPDTLVQGPAGTSRLEEAWPEPAVLWLHAANRQLFGEPGAC